MAKTASSIIKQAQSWIGRNEADGSNKVIIDAYNNGRPAGYYKMTYTDAWCACFVSAVAMKCDCTDIIPVEVGCERMIQLFKMKGCWVENDAHVPSPGDIVFYDWDDSGVGDNTGWSDHVGIVEQVTGTSIAVIEGNYSDAVKRRHIKVNSQFIRGYGVPKYSNAAAPQPSTPAESKPVVTTPSTSVTTPTTQKKPVEEVAKEVRKGMWGNGATRINKLRAAGYNPNEVQKAVNQLMNVGASTKKSVDDIAKEVRRGEWGNGADRINRLRAAGYNPNEVQRAVNALYKK